MNALVAYVAATAALAAVTYYLYSSIGNMEGNLMLAVTVVSAALTVDKLRQAVLSAKESYL